MTPWGILRLTILVTAVTAAIVIPGMFPGGVGPTELIIIAVIAFFMFGNRFPPLGPGGPWGAVATVHPVRPKQMLPPQEEDPDLVTQNEDEPVALQEN